MDSDDFKRSVLAELADGAVIGDPQPVGEMLAVVRREVEGATGVPCVAQVSADGNAIVVTQAINYGAVR